MMTIHPKPRRTAVAGLAAIAVSAALLLSGCTGTTEAPKGDGQLLVWTDATRQPAVEAYATAHPDQKITVVTVDGADLSSKLSLIAKDTASLPDVVFTPNGESVIFAQKYGFSADLSTLVDKTVLDGFGATLSACTENGKIYCLPLDISTQMLWYNKTAFDEFGYTVPTTWAEYATLSAKIATEHPGYIVGSCGDTFCPNVYYRGSNCPGISLDGTSATIDLASNKDCTRVTDMLEPLIADKTVATLSPFDPDMATLGTNGKVLMFPGFVWYGSVLFRDTFKNADGVIAAAPLPTWPDGVKGAGAAVGGQWIVSSKSGDSVAATALAVAMTTDATTLADAVTFPAYEPAAADWISKAAATGFYAVDPTTTFTSARADVTGDLFTPPGFDILNPFANAAAPKLKAGDSLSSVIGSWQDAVKQTLADAGYTPVIK